MNNEKRHDGTPFEPRKSDKKSEGENEEERERTRGAGRN
jgi:hypothetical protein